MDLNLFESLMKPIEAVQVDSGKLYVSLDDKCQTEFQDGWTLPSASQPGEWKLFDKDDWSREISLIRLYTLSGLILGGYLKSHLFVAIFQGFHEDITSFVYSPLGETEDTRYLKMVKRGKRVEKASLVYEVEKWSPKIAFSFAWGCINHALSHLLQRGSRTKDLYREGLEYARLLTRFEIDGYKDEIETYFQLKKINTKYSDYEKNLIARLESEASDDLLGGYLGKALVSLLTRLTNYVTILENLKLFDDIDFMSIVRNSTYPIAVNEVSKFTRIYFAWRSFGEFSEKGINVSWNPKTEKEKTIRNRIWYGHQKKELDWQATYLSELLEE